MSGAGGHWFLPETPDVVGLLRGQVAVTIDGLDALVSWAAGADGAREALEDAQRRGDEAMRSLLSAVRSAFITPLEPEDVFALSRGLDWILDYSGDLVKESQALSEPPDEGIAEMAQLLAAAVRKLDTAIANLEADPDAATASADEAIALVQQLDTVYYRGMGELLEVKGMRGRVSRRELYRQCTKIGDVVIDVAERVVYAIFKGA